MPGKAAHKRNNYRNKCKKRKLRERLDNAFFSFCPKKVTVCSSLSIESSKQIELPSSSPISPQISHCSSNTKLLIKCFDIQSSSETNSRSTDTFKDIDVENAIETNCRPTTLKDSTRKNTSSPRANRQIAENDPLYIKFKEYSLLCKRLKQLTEGPF